MTATVAPFAHPTLANAVIFVRRTIVVPRVTCTRAVVASTAPCRRTNAIVVNIAHLRTVALRVIYARVTVVFGAISRRDTVTAVNGVRCRTVTVANFVCPRTVAQSVTCTHAIVVMIADD